MPVFYPIDEKPKKKKKVDKQTMYLIKSIFKELNIHLKKDK